MRILVVGLLDKQASIVRSRFGKRLDIEFIKLAKHGNGDFLAKLEHADHVLYLQKFCSHEITRKIPVEKRKLITGMTSLMTHLEHLDVMNHMATSGSPAAPVAKPVPAPEVVPATDTRLFMDALDVSVARMLQPGDCIYFRKPEGMKLQNWKNTFHNKVHYYRKNYEISLEVSFTYEGEQAVACVLMPTAAKTEIPPRPEPEGVLVAPTVLPPTEPPVTFGPGTVSVPMELTSTALNKLRTDPRSRDTDVGCMDEKIGWLVRAWPAILDSGN